MQLLLQTKIFLGPTQSLCYFSHFQSASMRLALTILIMEGYLILQVKQHLRTAEIIAETIAKRAIILPMSVVGL